MQSRPDITHTMLLFFQEYLLKVSHKNTFKNDIYLFTLQDTISRMFRDIPGLRVAVAAQGDYCDEGVYGYVTK